MLIRTSKLERPNQLYHRSPRVIDSDGEYFEVTRRSDEQQISTDMDQTHRRSWYHSLFGQGYRLAAIILITALPLALFSIGLRPKQISGREEMKNIEKSYSVLFQATIANNTTDEELLSFAESRVGSLSLDIPEALKASRPLQIFHERSLPTYVRFSFLIKTISEFPGLVEKQREDSLQYIGRFPRAFYDIIGFFSGQPLAETSLNSDGKEQFNLVHRYVSEMLSLTKQGQKDQRRLFYNLTELKSDTHRQQTALKAEKGVKMSKTDLAYRVAHAIFGLADPQEVSAVNEGIEYAQNLLQWCNGRETLLTIIVPFLENIERHSKAAKSGIERKGSPNWKVDTRKTDSQQYWEDIMTEAVRLSESIGESGWIETPGV